MPTPAEVKETRRGDIEKQYNVQRANREKQYTADKLALEQVFFSDVNAIEQSKRAAFSTAGLNTDGSDPMGRPTG